MGGMPMMPGPQVQAPQAQVYMPSGGGMPQAYVQPPQVYMPQPQMPQAYVRPPQAQVNMPPGGGMPQAYVQPPQAQMYAPGMPQPQMSMGGGQMPQPKAPSRGPSTKLLLIGIGGLALLIIAVLGVMLLKK
jgi:hypothetical protein